MPRPRSTPRKRKPATHAADPADAPSARARLDPSPPIFKLRADEMGIIIGHLDTEDQNAYALACQRTHIHVCDAPRQHLRLLWRLYQHYVETRDDEDFQEACAIVDIWASNPEKHRGLTFSSRNMISMALACGPWICVVLDKLGWMDLLIYAHATSRCTQWTHEMHPSLVQTIIMCNAIEHGCPWGEEAVRSQESIG